MSEKQELKYPVKPEFLSRIVKVQSTFNSYLMQVPLYQKNQAASTQQVQELMAQLQRLSSQHEQQEGAGTGGEGEGGRGTVKGFRKKTDSQNETKVKRGRP